MTIKVTPLYTDTSQRQIYWNEVQEMNNLLKLLKNYGYTPCQYGPENTFFILSNETFVPHSSATGKPV